MMKQATCITTSARMFAVFPCTRHYTGVSLLWHYLCTSERCIWSPLEWLHFTALCPGLPGWASTRRNIHPPTYPDYQPIFINFLIYHDPQHPPCYVLDNLFAHFSPSPYPIWFTSCSGALHLILHTFLHPISVFFLQHMPIPLKDVLLQYPSLTHLFLVSLSTLYLGLLTFTLTSHIHLTILISACWSAISFSFLTGQVSLPCSMLLHTQLLYSLPLLINDIPLLVSNATSCWNLFHPIWILASTAALASPSTLNIWARKYSLMSHSTQQVVCEAVTSDEPWN